MNFCSAPIHPSAPAGGSSATPRLFSLPAIRPTCCLEHLIEFAGPFGDRSTPPDAAVQVCWRAHCVLGQLRVNGVAAGWDSPAVRRASRQHRRLDGLSIWFQTANCKPIWVTAAAWLCSRTSCSQPRTWSLTIRHCPMPADAIHNRCRIWKKFIRCGHWASSQGLHVPHADQIQNRRQPDEIGFLSRQSSKWL